MLYENAWAVAKAREPGFGVDAGEEAAKRARREARRLFKLADAVSSGLDMVLVVGAAGCVGAGVLAALLEGTAFSVAALDPALRGPLPPRVEGFARAAEALDDDALRRVLARCADVVYSADSGDRAPYAADPGRGWPRATLPFYSAIDSIDCCHLLGNCTVILLSLLSHFLQKMTVSPWARLGARNAARFVAFCRRCVALGGGRAGGPLHVCYVGGSWTKRRPSAPSPIWQRTCAHGRTEQAVTI